MPDDDSRASGERCWPIRDPTRTDARRIGVAKRNADVFYFPESEAFASYEDGDDDDEEPVEASSFAVRAEESVAEAIERVGEQTGIESLSDWATERVGDDEAD